MPVLAFEPVYNEYSRILILGSFPSVVSRKNNFYYGNPQNRFWRLLSALLSTAVPNEIAEKKALLLTHRIALYDAAASCSITGSSDASMDMIVPTDISPILSTASIKAVFANGNKAYQICKESLYKDPILLPSTSPANARYTMQMLIDSWQIILEYV